jgi:hypothetical protein
LKPQECENHDENLAISAEMLQLHVTSIFELELQEIVNVLDQRTLSINLLQDLMKPLPPIPRVLERFLRNECHGWSMQYRQ